MAKELFPDESALGKTIYTGTSQPVTILGIIDHMHGSWPGWDKVGNVALFPVITDETYARYMVRAKPGQRDAMMKLAEEALGKVDNGRVILRVRSLEYIAAITYADDRAMAVYLAVVIALLLGISALGIFGLAAFNVSTRTKQIGTRRAVGARRTRHPAVLPGRELADHDRWAWSWAACWRCCWGTGSARRSNSRG